MKIRKVINNNVVSSQDDNGIEVIVMGKGIGFQKKTGDPIEPEKIDKVFHLSDEISSSFMQLVSDIPYEYIKLSGEIVDMISKDINIKMSKNICITLADHISFAIERQKKGIAFENDLLWEIKRYYKTEFQAGEKALEYIREKTGIVLPEDEAASIAMHILNAESNGQIRKSLNMPEMVKEILNIVKYTLMIDFDEDSISFERFVTHLKFFIQRAVTQKYYETDEQLILFNQIKDTCKEEFECALKIKTYMEKKTNYAVSDEEILYLTMHINRVKRRSEQV